jgi:hypothetical protein
MEYQILAAQWAFLAIFWPPSSCKPGSCLAENQACTLLRRLLLKKISCMPLSGPFYSMLTAPAKPTFQNMGIPSLPSGSTFKSLLPGSAGYLGPMWSLLHLDTTFGKLPEI